MQSWTPKRKVVAAAIASAAAEIIASTIRSHPHLPPQLAQIISGDALLQLAGAIVPVLTFAIGWWVPDKEERIKISDLPTWKPHIVIEEHLLEDED